MKRKKDLRRVTGAKEVASKVTFSWKTKNSGRNKSVGIKINRIRKNNKKVTAN